MCGVVGVDQWWWCFGLLCGNVVFGVLQYFLCVLDVGGVVQVDLLGGCVVKLCCYLCQFVGLGYVGIGFGLDMGGNGGDYCQFL